MKKIFVITIIMIFVLMMGSCTNKNIDISTKNEIPPYTSENNIITTSINTLGSKDNPILISDYKSLNDAFSNFTYGKYYKLTNDIVYSHVFEIETYAIFEGYLDGDNHLIRNIYFSGGGLFNVLNGEVRNLRFECVYALATSRGEDLSCGIVANTLKRKGVIENCSIANSKISAYAYSLAETEGKGIKCHAGGIVGYMESNSSVINCKIDGLDAFCGANHHDKGWQKDPISETPWTYFGGVTACVTSNCVISNNEIRNISCIANNSVRICCLAADTYSIMSLAGLIGYADSKDYSLENNIVDVNLKEFVGYLYSSNEGFFGIIGKEKNWCKVSEYVGYVNGSLNVGIDSQTGKKIYR